MRWAEIQTLCQSRKDHLSVIWTFCIKMITNMIQYTDMMSWKRNTNKKWNERKNTQKLQRAEDSPWNGKQKEKRWSIKKKFWLHGKILDSNMSPFSVKREKQVTLGFLSLFSHFVISFHPHLDRKITETNEWRKFTKLRTKVIAY